MLSSSSYLGWEEASSVNKEPQMQEWCLIGIAAIKACSMVDATAITVAVERS